MAPTKMNEKQRLAWFISNLKVTKKCWLWQGPTDTEGYARAKIGGRTGRSVGVHRLSYEWFNGPFDQSLDVLHRCDTPPCVNPKHLFLGTQADNNHDMAEKGRACTGIRPKGNAHGMSLLRERDIPHILKMKAMGVKHHVIAKKYGVSPSTIQYVGRKTWLWMT